MTGSVLVTGARGFIGQHVVAQLLAAGRSVVAVDHRWSDIGDVADLVDRAADGSAPVTAAIHLGWYAEPTDYLTAGAENLRCVADSLDLVELLVSRSVGHLVVTGSGAEYGTRPEPHEPSELPDPWSPYGTSKAALHLALRSRLAGLPTTLAWARIFNLTGPGEHPERVCSAVTRSLLRRSPIDLTSGTQVRDMLDVADVADAVIALADHPDDLVVNVCRGHGVPLRSLFELLADAVDEQLGTDDSRELLHFGARPAGPNDPPAVLGTNDELCSATGWTPTISLPSMARRLVGHHLDQLQREATHP